MNTTRAGHDTIPVRLPRTLIDKLRPIAAEHDRSLAAELRVALTAYVREQARELVMNDTRAIRTQIKGGQATQVLLTERDWLTEFGWEVWQLPDGRFVAYDEIDTGPAAVLAIVDTLEGVEAELEFLETTPTGKHSRERREHKGGEG